MDRRRSFPKALLRAVVLMGAAGRFAGLPAAPPNSADDAWRGQRVTMVAEEVEAAGVADPRVLKSLRDTPRHEFVPADMRRYAYVDAALPIGQRQTISPPYVVAAMTAALDPQPGDRVLEIGTGSGYQAAVLSPLVREVCTIEIVEPLGRRAAATLKRLGYANVQTRIGDGYLGWPEKAPFEKIIVTCSPEKIPQPLVEQLNEGGVMIIPVGERYQQNLYRVTKRNGQLDRQPLQATLFVPMTGQAEDSRQVRPDPLEPAIRNGGFEEVLADSDQPAGWHYLRRARAVNEASPAGRRLLRFQATEPGQPTRALQGLAVDGRFVSRLRLRCQVRGEELQRGPDADAQAALAITFYDERRAAVGTERLGPWSGTFGWRQESAEVPVPLDAREAIVRLGMHGGIGRLDVDELSLEGITSP